MVKKESRDSPRVLDSKKLMVIVKRSIQIVKRSIHDFEAKKEVKACRLWF